MENVVIEPCLDMSDKVHVAKFSTIIGNADVAVRVSTATAMMDGQVTETMLFAERDIACETCGNHAEHGLTLDVNNYLSLDVFSRIDGWDRDAAETEHKRAVGQVFDFLSELWHHSPGASVPGY